MPVGFPSFPGALRYFATQLTCPRDRRDTSNKPPERLKTR